MKLFFIRRRKGRELRQMRRYILFLGDTCESRCTWMSRGSIDFVVQSLNILKYYGESSVLNSKWELLLVVYFVTGCK